MIIPGPRWWRRRCKHIYLAKHFRRLIGHAVRTCHNLPPSEIDGGLFLAVFTGAEGRYLFHRIGWKGRIWQLCSCPGVTNGLTRTNALTNPRPSWNLKAVCEGEPLPTPRCWGHHHGEREEGSYGGHEGHDSRGGQEGELGLHVLRKVILAWTKIW